MNTYEIRRTRADKWNQCIIRTILPNILPDKEGWKASSLDADYNHSTDLVSSDGTTLSLRCRFDYPEYFSDITFRASSHSDELDKLDAAYILYAVTNGPKHLKALYLIDVSKLNIAHLKTYRVIQNRVDGGFRPIPIKDIREAVLFCRIA